MSSHYRPIGVFDSGIGGLTVARRILTEIPGEDIIYVGDTAHVPYGSKSISELMGYAEEILDFFEDCSVKVVVAACNTSSAVSIPVLRAQYQLPIIDVIEPGVRGAIRASKKRRIAVLATEATANSGAYSQNLLMADPGVQVAEIACPRLVPLVEAGNIEGPEVADAISEYLEQVRAFGADTVVLGCTHYPYLRPVIEAQLGPGTVIVDPAVETVETLKRLLAERNLLSVKAKGTARFYCTGPEDSFLSAGTRFLGRELSVQRVHLEKNRKGTGTQCG
ncbi:MAG: glutamate racemase [Solirubrobacterales bacterium]